ncbi:hypothetical protein M9458_042833, partial [Cirrhinus mrigala]
WGRCRGWGRRLMRSSRASVNVERRTCCWCPSLSPATTSKRCTNSTLSTHRSSEK